jgi:tetratricopeptide (TPR) repeat protein
MRPGFLSRLIYSFAKFEREKTFRPRSGWASAFRIVTIVLISCAVYFNALSNDFVYDDGVQVVNNHWIRDIKHLPDIFSQSVWSFQKVPVLSNYYRPLMHVIYMLAYSIFGLKPWGFHLVNILFHAGNSILVFIIAARLLGPEGGETTPLHDSRFTIHDSRFLAFIAAILFATHPIHTEAVTWVAGLPDVSFTFFFVLSFWFYIRFRESAGPADKLASRQAGKLASGNYLLSLVSFAIATLLKEPALTLGIILAGYDVCFRKAGDRAVDKVRRYVPFLLIAVVYLMMRSVALGGLAPQKRHDELGALQLIINVFPLFTQYLEKLLLPANLNCFYVFHPIKSMLETKGILSLFVTTAFILLAFVTLKKNRTAFFSLLLIVVPLLPVLYIPGLGENTFAERYLYLPSVGFVMLAASLLAWIKANFPRLAFMVGVISILVIGSYSAATISRNSVWKDDYTLFSDTVKKSPDAAVPRYCLGAALVSRGQLNEAIKEYYTALALKPNFSDVHAGLGNAYVKIGLPEKAREEYQVLVTLEPANAEAHGGLGDAYVRLGLPDKAVEEYQVLMKLDPDNYKAYISLGGVYLSLGFIDKAIEQYRISLELYPDNAGVHNTIGGIYGQSGSMDKAVEHFRLATKLDPGFADAHYNLGVALRARGLTDQATEHLETAVRLNPSDPVFRSDLAKTYELRKPR